MTKRATATGAEPPRSATEVAIRRRASFRVDDAAVLTEFFAGVDGAAGAKSTLAGVVEMLKLGAATGNSSGTNGAETAAVARADRWRRHYAPILRALDTLPRWHQAVLRLTHGCLPSALPPQVVSEFGMTAAVALCMPELAARHAGARSHGTNVPASPAEWLLQLCAGRVEAELAGIATDAEAHLGAAHAAFRAAREATRETSPQQRQAAEDRRAAERQRRSDAGRRGKLAAMRVTVERLLEAAKANPEMIP
jgi:hypothetical protein